MLIMLTTKPGCRQDACVLAAHDGIRDCCIRLMYVGFGDPRNKTYICTLIYAQSVLLQVRPIAVFGFRISI